MIEITQEAANRINELKEEQENPSLFLRLSVNGGGCSGFQYTFTLDSEKTGDDETYTQSNAEVVVDNVSLSLLNGAIIDFEDEMAGSKFIVKNPNATTSCGCGNSFSI